MPKAGMYQTNVVADVLKRQAAGKRVSYSNAGMGPGKEHAGREKQSGAGKFGGLPGGPSGGGMNPGGKRRSGRRVR